MSDVRPTRYGEDRHDGGKRASEQERLIRLQARGAVLCELTEDLIRRSRRALERTRALLGDYYRIVDRSDQQR